MRLAHKNSVGDDKSRQIVKTTYAVSSTNDTKALANRPHITKKRSKHIPQREWTVDNMHVQMYRERPLNTDEPLARICAATDIASTDPFLKNLHVENNSECVQKKPLSKHTRSATPTAPPPRENPVNDRPLRRHSCRNSDTIATTQRKQKRLQLRSATTNKQCAMRRVAR